MTELILSPELRDRLSAVKKSVRAELNKKKIGHAGVEHLIDRMGAGLEKHSFDKLIGRGNRRYNNRTTSEKLWRFLEGPYAIPGSIRQEIHADFDTWLRNQRESELWRGALYDLKSALGYGEAPPLGRSAPLLNTHASNVGETTRPLQQDSLQAYSAISDPTNTPEGRSTGFRHNHISELCHAEAEWRNTNLGQHEGRWLQLLVHFKQSYTRSRGRGGGIELSVHVHRVHVETVLDGGLAERRDLWFEGSASGDDKIQIFEGNSWTPERPCYEIDNPTRATPLTGHYDWFDLCQISGAVGDNASLELSVSIGGISISLPDDIRAQLDPCPTHPYDSAELHLIEGWLRHRLVPRSRLKAGLYQLTQIDLRK